MKPTIAIDIDHVILDFCAQYETACKEYLNRSVKPILKVYDLATRYQLTKKEAHDVWHYMINAGHWERMPPLEGSVEAVNLLVKEGFDVQLVTRISPVVKNARLKNLKDIGVPDVKMHCVDGSKFEILQKINPIVFVDDVGSHILESFDAGVPYRIQVESTHQASYSIYASHIVKDLYSALPIISHAANKTIIKKSF